MTMKILLALAFLGLAQSNGFVLSMEKEESEGDSTYWSHTGSIDLDEESLGASVEANAIDWQVRYFADSGTSETIDLDEESLVESVVTDAFDYSADSGTSGTIDLDERSLVISEEVDTIDWEAGSELFMLYESLLLLAPSQEQEKEKLQEEIINAARTLCQKKYLNGKQLSSIWVNTITLSNDFDVPVALIFLKYGADLNYALTSILKKEDSITPPTKSFIEFLLSFGAQLPRKSRVPKSIQSLMLNKETLKLLQGLHRQYNSNISDVESRRIEIRNQVEKLFLLATGERKVAVLKRILRLFGHLLTDNQMQNAFIRGAYAGSADIVRRLRCHNEECIIQDSHTEQGQGAAWMATLIEALQLSGLRPDSHSTFREILDWVQQKVSNLSLQEVVKHFISLQERSRTPYLTQQRYAMILNELNGNTRRDEPNGNPHRVDRTVSSYGFMDTVRAALKRT